MKTSEFKKLIREEVRRVLAEGTLSPEMEEISKTLYKIAKVADTTWDEDAADCIIGLTTEVVKLKSKDVDEMLNEGASMTYLVEVMLDSIMRNKKPQIEAKTKAWIRNFSDRFSSWKISLSEVDGSMIAVYSIGFNAPLMGKDRKTNKTYSGPYKLSSKPTVEYYDSAKYSGNPQKQKPHAEVLTMFRSQTIGEGLDKFVLKFGIPHTGDQKKDIAEFAKLINKTLSAEPSKISGGFDDGSFGAVFQNTAELKAAVLNALQNASYK